jgi:general stress protein 26
VEEIAEDQRVGVTFVDSGAETYVSVAGHARITNNRAQIAEFWNPFYKAWFDGPDDPTIRVVEITPESAEYWVTKGGKIVSLVSMLASAVTGKNLEAGENKTITL